MDLAWVETWRRPRSREELVLAPGESVVAGGTWLFSEPQPSVTGLVDLTELAWASLSPLIDGGVSIAATCTIQTLQSAHWPASIGAVVRSCADALLMSWKVQQAATVGGNLCLALPAGAMISFLAALDGEMVIWTPDGGERRERVVDFVRGVGDTSLKPGEIVRAIEAGPDALGDRYAFRRISLTEHGRSAAVVIARRTPTGDRLVVTAATPAPVVLELTHSPTPAEVTAAIGTIETWHDDVHGAQDWRAAQTLRLALDALTELDS
ncbi:FAD binding domain-containing protein [Nocardioides sp. Kera G14]|uniref:FAD binding domain-containing protein n=1 Tax=Nocardioides sp. Kera G14 TaxID=2884264 RepID=UPI001D0F5F65|nr:FAD binding domain-containing protein [Nocardioides sp. Kera G14]UDY22861.1 FAD binding domain-containing protein [Nocardioides sp. Kera G14]